MEISSEQLAALRLITTPTLSNAIELFDVRPRNVGFMSPDIKCLFPDLGVMVGYAVTARFTSEISARRPASRGDFWEHLARIPQPRVLVLQDLDQPAGFGAFVGEVMATIHQRLGCVGVITNGHLRDLDEAHALGFHFFAAGACVSHAYVDLVDFGTPVKVGGLEVKDGDLLHADKHGVLSVPHGLVSKLPQAVETIVAREKRILDYCKAPGFELGHLKQLFEH